MNPSPSFPVSRARPQAGLAALAVRIRQWAGELGFDQLGISDVATGDAQARLNAWLEAGYHGGMDYMAKHGIKRTQPAMLTPGTQRVISVRMAYLPACAAQQDWRARERARLADPRAAVVSLYARGRDYHKVLRQRLQQLAQRIEQETGAYGWRVFTDSAPVMEVEFAQKSGLGWRGKHSLLLSRDAGSMFFLGEIYVDLPLPVSINNTNTVNNVSEKSHGQASTAHCGRCTRCITACPTGAIVSPGCVDARRCISYLTIEHPGSIPEALRGSIGNHVYGCDDCQLACPWNKFAQPSCVQDFEVRHGLDGASLVELAAWSEPQFNERMQGSAIRRIGYEQWSRNLAVAMGNALTSGAGLPDDNARAAIVAALRARADDASALVREHVLWALQQGGRAH